MGSVVPVDGEEGEKKAPEHEEKDSSAHGTPPVLSSYTVRLASLARVPSRRTSE